MKTVLLAGATGLIGSTALQAMFEDPRINRVVALVRKPLATAHPQLEQWVANGDLLTGLRDVPVDAVVCCLGTTIHTVGGDQQKFIHVDKDLVVGLARWAKAHGATHFAVISAVGADASSRVFYSRVKGEMERDVQAVELPALHIFHPSILTGARQEKRAGERIGIVVMNAIAPLLPHRYRPMPNHVLAQAAVNAAVDGATGVHRHTYDAIVKLAKG